MIVLAWVGIAWLCGVAARQGIAASLAGDHSETLARWGKSGVQPPLDEWLSVRNDLARAARLSPSDPAARELLGVLHAQRSGSEEFAILAREHFAAAIERRPTSPYAWSSYAQVLYRLGRTGRELEGALVNALRMGPSEREVQEAVADLGLALWDEIQPATRTVVEGAIAAGMRRDPAAMLTISQRRGRLNPACRHVESIRRANDPKWSQLCDSRGKQT